MSKQTLCRLLAFALGSSFLVESTPMDNIFEASPRIVGGWNAAPGQFPYYVEFGGCGGALIASDIVLFAAHCVSSSFPGTNKIYIGGTDTQQGQERRCKQILVNPQYIGRSNYWDYDYALCKLDRPISNFNVGNVQLVLNPSNNVPVNDQEMIVMGFGFEQAGSGSLTQDLKYTFVQYTPNNECRAAYGNGAITDRMLCGGTDTGGQDACSGDSGGPIVTEEVLDDGTVIHTHVGVVSWGRSCADVRWPGVYARTSAVYSWIIDEMCNTLKSGDKICFTPSPSLTPSLSPSTSPSLTPSLSPSTSPSLTPSFLPSTIPSATPTASTPFPTVSTAPSDLPSESVEPSSTPSRSPSTSPSLSPSSAPSTSPSSAPSSKPSQTPSDAPSGSPSFLPTNHPTETPSVSPTGKPSASPSQSPTIECSDDETYQFKGNKGTCQENYDKLKKKGFQEKKVVKFCEKWDRGHKVQNYWCRETCSKMLYNADDNYDSYTQCFVSTGTYPPEPEPEPDTPEPDPPVQEPEPDTPEPDSSECSDDETYKFKGKTTCQENYDKLKKKGFQEKKVVKFCEKWDQGFQVQHHWCRETCSKMLYNADDNYDSYTQCFPLVRSVRTTTGSGSGKRKKKVGKAN